jgi:hypothetical protein
MSDITDTQPSEIADTQSLTFRITDELAAKISGAVTSSKLNRSALLRLAVDRGIDRLLEQLEAAPIETTNTEADQ